MALVDLDLVKKHLRVDWDDEDVEIEAYAAAAEAIVTEYLDRTVQATGPLPSDDPNAMVVTPPITAAILLVTNDLFDNRTSDVVDGEAMLSPTVRRLLAPYRIWRQFEEANGRLV
ncbi:Phage gp6-like head-tail connector protein [Devosia lucknowensis]|uniref:Phage gp6-like head-tail connector protein n=1 Tax=Devosia lucknowensis TaxID=1096929 RepID=A0A1Y6EUB4_9HYPH|nr:head-tail connector protein [Devosia lucknowensis]SMQ65886.1 Phage gp6-like head-tail connector protein [Devosia lucknowensis]